MQMEQPVTAKSKAQSVVVSGSELNPIPSARWKN